MLPRFKSKETNCNLKTKYFNRKQNISIDFQSRENFDFQSRENFEVSKIQFFLRRSTDDSVIRGA